jgi:hypothetical protein
MQVSHIKYKDYLLNKTFNCSVWLRVLFILFQLYLSHFNEIIKIQYFLLSQKAIYWWLLAYQCSCCICWLTNLACDTKNWLDRGQAGIKMKNKYYIVSVRRIRLFVLKNLPGSSFLITPKTRLNPIGNTSPNLF